MTKLKIADLKDFLDEKYEMYNRLDFIASDPISIPHQFVKKEDIEISAFLAATIAWGQRVTIINNTNKLMKLMGNSPHDFVLSAKEKDYIRFDSFKHRTFNGIDAVFFIKSLQNIYRKHGGLQEAFLFGSNFASNTNDFALQDAIMNFRNLFFSIPYPARTSKHVSNPYENSSSKRLCMYLRWMIRNDKGGVDFGLWKPSLSKNIKQPATAFLMCPLDVHTGNVARKLGILKRTQNDWKAVEELTANLRTFDLKDPVKYDFALFGLGVFEGF